jgi:hypothetical protein
LNGSAQDPARAANVAPVQYFDLILSVRTGVWCGGTRQSLTPQLAAPGIADFDIE